MSNKQSGLYNIIGKFHQALGSINPRIKRLGFTPAGLFGINRYRWCGPGNRMDIAPATNSTDKICQKHDLEYDKIFKSNLQPQEEKRQIRMADEDFLNEQKKIIFNNREPIQDRFMSAISYAGIGLKKFADNFGNKTSENDIVFT